MESTQHPTPTMPPRRVPDSHAGTAGNGARGDGAPDPSAYGHDEIDLNVPKPRAASVVVAGVLAVGALAALLVTGMVPRHRDQKELTADAADARNAPVLVNAVLPRRGPTTVEISLPGTMRPWQEVSIFARTTGYLKKYYVDISNNVEAGQLMAEIDAPEVDQELDQSKAALLQTKAAANRAVTDRDLAKVTLDRYTSLKETH